MTFTPNYNSNKNQEIKRKFVECVVKACFTKEMDSIFKVADHCTGYDLPSLEDVENLYEYKCPECGEGYQSEEQAKQCCASKKQIESEPQEIYEWWIVTEYLYTKLKDKGEPVIVWGNNYYWGRCTTGQAIFLDNVISEIAEDMEILEGQKNSWE